MVETSYSTAEYYRKEQIMFKTLVDCKIPWEEKNPKPINYCGHFRISFNINQWLSTSVWRFPPPTPPSIASKGFQTIFVVESYRASASVLPQGITRTANLKIATCRIDLGFLKCYLICIGMSAIDSQKDNYLTTKCKNYKQKNRSNCL